MLLNHTDLSQLIFFQEIFYIRIDKLHIYIVLSFLARRAIVVVVIVQKL